MPRIHAPGKALESHLKDSPRVQWKCVQSPLLPADPADTV